MIRQASDRGELNRYVTAVRDSLDAPELRDAARRAATTIGAAEDPVGGLRSRIPNVEPQLASSGGRSNQIAPYLSRDPVQSLLQSTLESKLRDRGVPERPPRRDLLGRIIHLIRSLLHPLRFGPTDPEWVFEVAKATLDRLADGNHPFNPEPALHEIGDRMRLVVVGDWGTGLPRARDVARFMAEEVADALRQDREVHVVHLGDVYYSGTEDEVRRNMLALWPVSDEQAAAGVTSWSLNGNHDMYGGGFGYFETLLGDRRFAAQRSPDRKATSFFQISSPGWEIIALDTSWNSDPLFGGHVGVLEDPQAEFVERVAAQSDKKLMLLSHHQLISVYDEADLGPTLGRKLAPVLDRGRIAVWLWGHEHRCMGFAADRGIAYPRCIGHGGVPVLMEHAENDPVPAPGLWEERGFLVAEGDHWARFGFAILDFAGERIDVRYRDDTGTVTRTETFG